MSPLGENLSNYHESPFRQTQSPYPLTMIDSELSHTKICGKGMIDKILGKQESARKGILPFGGYHPFDAIEVPDSPVTVYSSYEGVGSVGDPMPEQLTDENSIQFNPVRLSADKHGVEVQHTTPVSRKSSSFSVSSTDHGKDSTPSVSSRKSNKSSSSTKPKSAEKRRLSSLLSRLKSPMSAKKAQPLPAVEEKQPANCSDAQKKNGNNETKSNDSSAQSTQISDPVNTSSSSLSSETDAVLQAMRDLVLKQQEALQALAEEKARYAKELEMQRASVSTLQTVNQEQTEKISLLASTNQQVQSESEWLREQVQAIRNDMMSLQKCSAQQLAQEEQRQCASRKRQSNPFSMASSNFCQAERRSDSFCNFNSDMFLGMPSTSMEKSNSFTDSDSLTNESGVDTFPLWSNVEGYKDLYRTEKTANKMTVAAESKAPAPSAAPRILTRPMADHGATRTEWGDNESLFASLSDDSLGIKPNTTPYQSFDVFHSNDGSTTVLKQKPNDNQKLKPALKATKITVSRVDPPSKRSVKFNSPLSETNSCHNFLEECMGDNAAPKRKPSKEEIWLFRNRLEALQERREQRKTRQTTIRWDENFFKESKGDQQQPL